jgi:hypothetical protein
MKINNPEFWSILRENGGVFQATADAIKKEFGISYTRQAVRERALGKPEELKDIEERNIDLAETGIHSLMKTKNEAIQLRACELYLKTKGKSRGYVERQEIEVDGDFNLVVEFVEPE